MKMYWIVSYIFFFHKLKMFNQTMYSFNLCHGGWIIHLIIVILCACTLCAYFDVRDKIILIWPIQNKYNKL